MGPKGYAANIGLVQRFGTSCIKFQQFVTHGNKDSQLENDQVSNFSLLKEGEEMVR
jgi:hypothetical protein